ncbi:two component transcriptional regulator, LytTR family [Desulfofarcimen acetoxidans DSM 771]|uniref:Stage 0 sporulation protein A homolog n=1 Tax=Desulfofarcimen acetoxidans (strain ATCC 49208 / DSM 771 / KCTC 5769 / VKM B-1644 / 5575) TaxID=485916 RepID=C8W4Y1_DESAS|nr:LytTR family DNA-binding domain-containing protein [Desulfofarcimen acetoxidans]ACV61333.1 two component transcriptional regulator, LytTR family [Desulfofarcimen acetoxidans DSM 771]
MRVIIAEDNPVEMRYLKNLLSRESDIEIIGEVSDGWEATKMISKLQPEVAFLDISMPGISGMDLVRKFDGRVIIVLVTAHHEYALDAFEAGSMDYLLKPVEPERVSLTIRRLRKILSRKTRYSGRININTKDSIIAVEIDSIIFIEKVPLAKKIKIQTVNNEYIVSGTLNEFEDKLKSLGFIRTHKSFIINPDKLEKMIPWGDKSYLAKMHGVKKEALVSRKYAGMVKSAIKW